MPTKKTTLTPRQHLHQRMHTFVDENTLLYDASHTYVIDTVAITAILDAVRNTLAYRMPADMIDTYEIDYDALTRVADCVCDMPSIIYID